MLVLSRRAGEHIQIGEGIFVTVVAVRHGRVRIGIDAPPYIEIRRGNPAVGEDLESCARQDDPATLNKVEGQDAAIDRRREQVTGRC